MVEENTQKEIELPLENIVDIALNEKNIAPKLYPTEDTKPLELITTKASISQLNRYEERLKEWQIDPIQKGGEGVEGFIIEIITAQTLANVFSDNDDIIIQLSPKELDFIDSKSFNYNNPSFDVIVAKKYKDGLIPLILIGTTASKKRRPRIHEDLQTELFNLTATEDLGLVFPAQTILEIGMDKSGKKFRDITNEKQSLLRNQLTEKFKEEKLNTSNPILIKKFDYLLEILNSKNNNNQEEKPSWAMKPSEEQKSLLKERFLQLDPQIFKHTEIKNSIFSLTKEFYKVIEVLGISAYIPGENFLLFKATVNKGSKDEVNLAIKIPILIDNMGIESINVDNTGLIITKPLSEEQAMITSPLETGDIEQYLNAMKEVINN